MRRRVGLVMAGFGVAAVALAGPGLDVALAQENTVVVVPDQGPPGVDVGVRSGPGGGCGTPNDPGDEALVQLVDPASGTPLVETRVALNPNATWVAALTVPGDVPPGVLDVLAACLVGGEVGFDYTPATFTVMPAATTTTTTTAQPSDDAAGSTDEVDRESTTVEKPSGTGARSLLPGLLAIVVVGLVLFIVEWLFRWFARRRGDEPTAIERGTNGRMGIYALIGVLAFIGRGIVAGWLQPDYSPRRELISALGAVDADYAWIMIGGFVAAGIGMIVLGFGLWRWFGRHGVGPFLLSLAGLFFVLAGLFRLDCSTTTGACEALDAAGLLSWHHGAHLIVSALALTFLWFATLVLGWAFRGAVGWAGFWLYSLVTIIVLAPLYALLVADVPGSAIGIVQRIAMTAALAWVAVIGIQLFRLCRLPR